MKHMAAAVLTIAFLLSGCGGGGGGGDGAPDVGNNDGGAATPPASISGLTGSYYDGYFNDDLSFFASNAPVFTRVDQTLDFQDSDESWQLGAVPPLQDLQTFSVMWTGRLVVPQTGTYTLYLNSDDASYLFLDGATQNLSSQSATVSNGDLHSVTEQSAEVQLSAGEHPITIVYGENTGNHVIEFSWSSASLNLPKQIVTALNTTP